MAESATTRRYSIEFLLSLQCSPLSVKPDRLSLEELDKWLFPKDNPKVSRPKPPPRQDDTSPVSGQAKSKSRIHDDGDNPQPSSRSSAPFNNNRNSSRQHDKSQDDFQDGFFRPSQDSIRANNNHLNRRRRDSNEDASNPSASNRRISQPDEPAGRWSNLPNPARKDFNDSSTQKRTTPARNLDPWTRNELNHGKQHDSENQHSKSDFRSMSWRDRDHNNNNKQPSWSRPSRLDAQHEEQPEWMDEPVNTATDEQQKRVMDFELWKEQQKAKDLSSANKKHHFRSDEYTFDDGRDSIDADPELEPPSESDQSAIHSNLPAFPTFPSNNTANAKQDDSSLPRNPQPKSRFNGFFQKTQDSANSASPHQSSTATTTTIATTAATVSSLASQNPVSSYVVASATATVNNTTTTTTATHPTPTQSNSRDDGSGGLANILAMLRNANSATPKQPEQHSYPSVISSPLARNPATAAQFTEKPTKSPQKDQLRDLLAKVSAQPPHQPNADAAHRDFFLSLLNNGQPSSSNSPRQATGAAVDPRPDMKALTPQLNTASSSPGPHHRQLHSPQPSLSFAQSPLRLQQQLQSLSLHPEQQRSANQPQPHLVDPNKRHQPTVNTYSSDADNTQTSASQPHPSLQHMPSQAHLLTLLNMNPQSALQQPPQPPLSSHPHAFSGPSVPPGLTRRNGDLASPLHQQSHQLQHSRPAPPNPLPVQSSNSLGGIHSFRPNDIAQMRNPIAPMQDSRNLVSQPPPGLHPVTGMPPPNVPPGNFNSGNFPMYPPNIRQPTGNQANMPSLSNMPSMPNMQSQPNFQGMPLQGFSHHHHHQPLPQQTHLPAQHQQSNQPLPPMPHPHMLGNGGHMVNNFGPMGPPPPGFFSHPSNAGPLPYGPPSQHSQHLGPPPPPLGINLANLQGPPPPGIVPNFYQPVRFFDGQQQNGGPVHGNNNGGPPVPPGMMSPTARY